MADLANEAVLAHRQAVSLQEAMGAAARRRDAAVAKAAYAGVPVTSLAARLGVNRQRVYAMIHAAKTAETKK